VHVFCDYYSLAIILIFAVLELWLIQHYLTCEQLFFYIIALLVMLLTDSELEKFGY